LSLNPNSTKKLGVIALGGGFNPTRNGAEQAKFSRGELAELILDIFRFSDFNIKSSEINLTTAAHVVER
jgi:hypothetical protein